MVIFLGLPTKLKLEKEIKMNFRINKQKVIGKVNEAVKKLNGMSSNILSILWASFMQCYGVYKGILEVMKKYPEKVPTFCEIWIDAWNQGIDKTMSFLKENPNIEKDIRSIFEDFMSSGDAIETLATSFKRKNREKTEKNRLMTLYEEAREKKDEVEEQYRSMISVPGFDKEEAYKLFKKLNSLEEENTILYQAWYDEEHKVDEEFEERLRKEKSSAKKGDKK